MSFGEHVDFIIFAGPGAEGGSPCLILLFVGDGELNGYGILIVLADVLGVDEAGVVDFGVFLLLFRFGCRRLRSHVIECPTNNQIINV